jgi:hypothetical protein
MQVNAKQRYLMITEAAYFLAEKRGFAPGHEHEDWLAAERQVEAMLAALEQQPALEQRLEAGGKPKRSRKAAAGAEQAKPTRRTRTTTTPAAEAAAPGAPATAETAKPTRATRARKTATAEKPAAPGPRNRAKGKTAPES